MTTDDGMQPGAADAQPMGGLEALDEFDEQASERIRSVLHDGRLFFSVVDTVGLLTGSSAPRQYWRDMKRRMAGEGWAETQAKCLQLKMPAPDGKQRLTDAADTETLLRIIQSIPSPKAEPLKQWLARVGAERLEEIEAPERAAVEHTLAHVGRWQGRRARYCGQRKNLFDLRRCAVVDNLHVVCRLYAQAQQAA